MKKQIKVKGHYRNGRYVRPHTRNIDTKTSQVNIDWLSLFQQSDKPSYTNSYYQQSPKNNDLVKHLPNQEPDPEKTLLGKYKALLIRVDSLIKEGDSLIESGREYINNPKRMIDEARTKKNQSLRTKFSVTFGLILLCSLIYFRIYGSKLIQDLSPRLNLSELQKVFDKPPARDQ